MAGEASRKAFFNEPGLSFQEGYKILLGGVPESKDIIQTDGEVASDIEEAEFVKRLTSLIRRDRMEASALPVTIFTFCIAKDFFIQVFPSCSGT